MRDQAAFSRLQTIWPGSQHRPTNTHGSRNHPVRSTHPPRRFWAGNLQKRYNFGNCARTAGLPTSVGQLGVVGTTPGNPAPGPPQLCLAEKWVCTLLRRSQFESKLASHHDKAGVSWLLNGITYGVSIAFSGPHTPYVSCNLPSAAQHPHIITAELTKEVEACRVLGPFGTIPMNTFRSSGLGAIPKKNGKDLSAPVGSSINDGIDKDQFPVQYSTVDDAVELISKYGTGTILAKIDLKAAFRMVPFNPKDWDLLSIKWQGAFT